MAVSKVSVLFQPSGRRGEVERGKTILQAAQELGVSIESVCGGKSLCGKCKVRLEPKLVLSDGEIVSPVTREETEFLSGEERKSGYRLACAAQLLADARIFVPQEAQGLQQVIRKDAREIPVELDPAVKSYSVELPPPTLTSPLADLERLKNALTASFGLHRLAIDFPALQTLPQRLRAGDWKVTVLVWMDREILDVRPGRLENFYGAAVDIGTTTVALYLCNLRSGQIAATGSMMNPQVSYGEDVMSRIAYVMSNPDGLKRHQAAIIEGLNELIRSTAATVSVPVQDILDMTIVGNTAMHHLFLGIDPQALGVSPFAPAVHQGLDVKARDLGLKVHAAANVHLLPIEAGFVGADNVGVLIAQQPYGREETSLIIDVGTNGELLLGNKKRLLSSSCATGPAFEGAHIKFGMRAAPGAIERVRISSGKLEVSYRIIGDDRWSEEIPPEEIQARGICGSGIIDAVAEMFRTGVLEKTGRINRSIKTPRLREGEKGYEFVLAWASETAIAQDITISLSDVRAVQLAKGALYCGAKIMMKVLGLERVEKVILAGGFGTYIDPEKAMTLGMFPDCDLKNVISVGNAAGDGARLALLNRRKRQEAEWAAKFVEYVELTTHPEFINEFAEATGFPHLKDPFPHLKEIFQRRNEIMK